MKKIFYAGLLMVGVVSAEISFEERVQGSPRKAAAVLASHEKVGDLSKDLIMAIAVCLETDPFGCVFEQHAKLLRMFLELKAACSLEQEFYGNDYDGVSCKTLQAVQLALDKFVAHQISLKLNSEDFRRERELFAAQ